MKEVTIYNDKGEIDSTVPLPEEVEFINNRCWKGASGVYYKGAGVPYTVYGDGELFWHASFDKEIPRVHIPRVSNKDGKHDAPYYGWTIRKPEFVDKTGIFMERYSPQFNECIGACGPRERALEINWDRFEYSGVEFLDKFQSVPDPWDNYIYKLNYYNKRVKWSEGQNINALIELLEYMIKEDWNVPWDIDVIGDVDINGLYTDVADIWKSTPENLKFKFGTVYTFVYGLLNMYGIQLSSQLVNKIIAKGKNRSFVYNDLEDVPFAVHNILSTWGYDIPLPSASREDQYHHMILNVLMEGSTCARCEARALEPDQEEAYSWWHVIATETRQKKYMEQFNIDKDYVLGLRSEMGMEEKKEEWDEDSISN